MLHMVVWLFTIFFPGPKHHIIIVKVGRSEQKALVHASLNSRQIAICRRDRLSLANQLSQNTAVLLFWRRSSAVGARLCLAPSDTSRPCLTPRLVPEDTAAPPPPPPPPGGSVTGGGGGGGGRPLLRTVAGRGGDGRCHRSRTGRPAAAVSDRPN